MSAGAEWMGVMTRISERQQKVCPPHDLRARRHAKIPAVVRTCRIPEEKDIQGRESDTSVPDWQRTPLGVGAPRCCDGSPVEHHRPALPADGVYGRGHYTPDRQLATDTGTSSARIPNASMPKKTNDLQRDGSRAAVPRPRHPQTAQHFVDCDLRHITRDTAPPK